MQAQSLETTDSGPFRRTVTPFVLLLVWAGETKATCLIPLDLSLESQRMCVRFWTHSLLWGCLWDPEVAKSICFEEGAWGSRRVQRLIWLELSLRKPSRQNNPGARERSRPADRTTLVHGRGQAKQGEWERHSPSVGNQSLIQRKHISNCLPCSGN